jgi:hypothetical protein
MSYVPIYDKNMTVRPRCLDRIKDIDKHNKFVSEASRKRISDINVSFVKDNYRKLNGTTFVSFARSK